MASLNRAMRPLAVDSTCVMQKNSTTD
jgi:hypothetical protein